MSAPNRAAEKNFRDVAYKIRTAANKGKVSTRIMYDKTNMKFIYRYRSKDAVPNEWSTHSEYDPSLPGLTSLMLR